MIIKLKLISYYLYLGGNNLYVKTTLSNYNDGWILSNFKPTAATNRTGVVLQVAASPDTATQAAGETPTKAEFDALLAELRDLKAKMRAGDAPILSS